MRDRGRDKVIYRLPFWSVLSLSIKNPMCPRWETSDLFISHTFRQKFDHKLHLKVLVFGGALQIIHPV